MMLISSSLDKKFRLKKISGKIVTSLSGYFSIESRLFKNISAHKVFQDYLYEIVNKKARNFHADIQSLRSRTICGIIFLKSVYKTGVKILPIIILNSDFSWTSEIIKIIFKF